MLPIFDLRRFTECRAQEREAFADELARACSEVGFFYLSGHDVAPETISRTREVTEAFFALPPAEKLGVERPRGRYRGYIPVMEFNPTAEGRPPVRYEAFLAGAEISQDDPAVAESAGLLMPNLWPAAPAGFRDAVLSYQAEMERVSEALLRAFGLALGGREDRLLGYFAEPLSNLSLLHYLPRPTCEDTRPDDARAHYDTNALTVLLPGEVGGLEAMTAQGRWREVPPQPGCFVVNLGNMLACWSGGRFESTLHRVQPPLGIDRYSLAYFAAPNYATRVQPLEGVGRGDPEACTEIHAGRALAEFVAGFDQDGPAYSR